jgi:hypothetical protein
MINWKAFRRKLSRPILRYNPGIFGSSLSIVSGYGLDYLTIEVHPRQRQEIFPLTSVQTISEAH